MMNLYDVKQEELDVESVTLNFEIDTLDEHLIFSNADNNINQIMFMIMGPDDEPEEAEEEEAEEE